MEKWYWRGGGESALVGWGEGSMRRPREKVRSTTNERGGAKEALLPSMEEVLAKARAPIWASLPNIFLSTWLPSPLLQEGLPHHPRPPGSLARFTFIVRNWDKTQNMVLILQACKVFRKCPRVSNSQSQLPLSRLASSPFRGYLPLPGVSTAHRHVTLWKTPHRLLHVSGPWSHASSLPTILCKLHTYINAGSSKS